jgi:hypothetical protein
MVSKMKKRRPVGRPATGTGTFATVHINREVREAVRRYLLKRELDTGERMNISEYIATAVLERLKRDRAEI